VDVTTMATVRRLEYVKSLMQAEIGGVTFESFELFELFYIY